MFDWSWIDDLDANEAADELTSVRDMLRNAECAQFLLAAHWADVNTPEYVEEQVAALPGMPRLRSVGDDCPRIDEYAGAALGALLGRSTAAADQFVADAVVVRHRHPDLWAAIKQGQVPVWVAVQVGRKCVTAKLTHEQAMWVDRETTPYISTLPTGRFLKVVEAKIIEADREAAEARARAEALARFVRAGRVDEHGLRTVVARAHAGDVTYLVAVLDRIAGLMAEQGDPRNADALRADALRVLANPARALALLTGAALDEADDAVETPGEQGHATLFAHGDAMWMRDAQGRPLEGVPDQEGLPLIDLSATELAGLALHGVVGSGGAPAVEEHLDPSLLERLLEALKDFDASRLDPTTTLYVHLTDTTLAEGRGVVRVEDVGPTTLGQVRDWLTHPFLPAQIQQQVRVRPVLDAAAVVPVERYEFSEAMDELGTCRTPYEVFPYGTLAARKADNDHPKPYQRGADPPRGQTSMENQAKLGRFHHRLKTNGGWTLRHTEPGVYWWRIPHGHWFRVDAAGTHFHGRDEELDKRWLLETVA